MQKEGSRPDSEMEEAFERLVEDGKERLKRPMVALTATGLLGGIDIGFGVLAFLVVKKETDNTLLAGIAFSIGFVALLLARSELFTENFLVPVSAVAAKAGTFVDLLRLWAVTLVTNLVGGAVIMWVVITARPDLSSTAAPTGEKYAELGVTLESFALAVLAGACITLMTRMQHGTRSTVVQVMAAILFGSLLAASELFHCVLDALFMFAAVFAGGDVGLGAFSVALVWSMFGNMVGGIGLVTALRLLRVPHKVLEDRRAFQR